MPGKKYKCDSLDESTQREILALYQQGYGYNYIENWLKDKGFTILRKQLQNWIDYKLEGKKVVENNTEKSEAYNSKISRDTTANPVIDKPEDLEKIRKVWGLPNIDVIDSDPEACIGASQRMAYDLFTSAGILVKNRLNLYQKGEAKYPLEQIKGMKLFYEMFAPLLGLNETVSLDAAMKTIKRAEKEYENFKKDYMDKYDDEDYEND